MLAAVTLSQAVNSVVPKIGSRSPRSAALYSYIAGVEFGVGLLISGMADPAKVLGFFSWTDPSRLDPSLSLILLFGVGPSLLKYIRMKPVYGNEKGKRPPTLAERFNLPTLTLVDIDCRFVVGAIAFGIGWGICGVCPGPGLLRSVLQPLWGVYWMGGFLLGSLLGI